MVTRHKVFMQCILQKGKVVARGVDASVYRGASRVCKPHRDWVDVIFARFANSIAPYIQCGQ